MDRRTVVVIAALATAASGSCDSPGATDPAPDPDPPISPVFYSPDDFVMGADLSYVNQVLDHGGAYSDSLGVRSPYGIFADHGANTARLRLWHDPSWVRTVVYEDPSVPLYSGLDDVIVASRAAVTAGLEVTLDIHYSDSWADVGTQAVPAAWRDITDLAVLEDSVYAYTRTVLESLDAEGAAPTMVQIGNETNCGMMTSGGGAGFPDLDVCDGHWAAQGAVLNAGIRAVREVAHGARVVLHVAQPEHVAWWLGNITTAAGVTDFDVIGFSYYPVWSSQSLSSLSGHIAGWRQVYQRDVMVMETAYPWTLQGSDSYTNILGSGSLVAGYAASVEGQRAFMIDLVQEVMDGGGAGVFYWEPAWITSGMRDRWGAGSAWENAALFDFQGAAHAGFEFYTYPYDIDS